MSYRQKVMRPPCGSTSGDRRVAPCSVLCHHENLPVVQPLEKQNIFLCGHCEKATRAPLPEEIAGQVAPQLTALIAYWTVVCRLPRRLVETMLADVLGNEISLGSTLIWNS